MIVINKQLLASKWIHHIISNQNLPTLWPRARLLPGIPCGWKCFLQRLHEDEQLFIFTQTEDKWSLINVQFIVVQLSVSHDTNVPVYSETRITFGQRVRAAATHGRVKPLLLFYPNQEGQQICRQLVALVLALYVSSVAEEQSSSAPAHLTCSGYLTYCICCLCLQFFLCLVLLHQNCCRQ